ncbi:MAG TPA: hypothetical protein VK666_12815 [Chryseolinea sp.]|nr:hypothetical protein [Chryseolinea sp.]
MKFSIACKSIAVLWILLLNGSETLFSQVKFEKGYFINKDNQQIECLIRNTDSHSTPQSFDYKLMEGDKTSTLINRDTKEVGILGYGRYIRAMVKIDRSNDYSNDINELSSKREPDWKDEELFLKVVIDGQAADLYSYYEKGFSRFFYSLGNSSIEQLIYKPYKTNESAYTYNSSYLNQLNENIKCDPADRQVLRPDYKEKDLVKYFVQFNACKGSPVAKAVQSVKTRRFSFMIMSGIEHGALQAEWYQIRTITKFDSKINPFIGAEFEYTMPFNRNKLSLLLDIQNSHYQSTGKDSVGVARVNFNDIETAIGPRYHFFINDNFNFFLNAMVVLDFKTSADYQWTATKQNYYSAGYSLDIKTYAPVFAFGAGCAYKNISAEFRYLTPKELFPEDTNYGSSYKRMTLLVKYRILKF